MSASPYPASAMPHPMSASPYPGYVAAPVKPRLSAWVWVLAALSVVLLVVAGTLGLRYGTVRAANEQAITERAAKIEELNETLRRLADERDRLDEEQASVLAAITDIGAQIDEHEACPDAVLAFDDALGSGTEAEQRAAFEAMVAVCNLRL
jgi:septal ring factor EnvC (AmiA/AmiB activator)